MAMVALKRESEAYKDAVADYQRQLRSYNNNVTEFKESFYTNDSGNQYVYKPASVEIGYVFDPTTYQLVPHEVPVKEQYFVVDSKGKLKATAKPAGNYGFTDLEKGYQALRLNPDATGSYPQKPEEWTKTFDAKEPVFTSSQMKKLDQPSLIDVERVSDKGLISSAFNF